MKEDKSKICLSCLACCKKFWTVVTDDLANPDIRELYEARGWTCHMGIVKGKRTNAIVTDLMPCPNLTPFGCKVYPERPKICRTYDGRKDPFMASDCKWKD
jgi:Fe-S-cluster containining protein